MKFEIKSRWTGEVKIVIEGPDFKTAIQDAVRRGSDLRGSNLSGSNLRGSNLSDSDLRPIRDDFWAVLCSSPKEVAGLRRALVEGRIDGSSYNGECVCLVGTLAKERNIRYCDIPGLSPNADRPAERFFSGIKKGDTPETNPLAKTAVEWIDHWTANMQEAFAAQ